MSDHHHHHHHDHSGPIAIGATAAKVVVGLLTSIGVLAVIAAVVLWPSHQHIDIPIPMQNGGGGAVQTQAGTVTVQDVGPCGSPSNGKVFDDTPQPPPNNSYSCGRSVVSIESGPDKGKHTLLEIPPGPDQPKLKVGDHIRVSRQNDPSGTPNYAFEDYSRGLPLTLIVIFFVVVVVAVARWRGLRAVIGLGLAFAVLIEFMLPALLDGKPALPVAVVAGTLILYAVLYLAHGVNLRTSSALLGTLSAMLLATVLSWVTLKITHVTGLSQEDNTNVATYVQHVSITGLLLAGFIIGSLGVLNDVTITQASAAFELAAIDETHTRRDIFVAAMRVGKDHIASTVYTLVLAYAGGALPLLLLFSVAGRSLGDVVTGDAVAIEIARSAVGGVCLALSVPLTTVIAVLLARPFSLRSEPEPEPAPRRARRPKEGSGEPHSHRGGGQQPRRRAAEHRHTADDDDAPDEDEDYLHSLSREAYQPRQTGRRRADPEGPARHTAERNPGRSADTRGNRPADTGAQAAAPHRRVGPRTDTQTNRLPPEPDSYRQAPPRRHAADPGRQPTDPRSTQPPSGRRPAEPYGSTTGGWPTTSGRHTGANYQAQAPDPGYADDDYDEPTHRQQRRTDNRPDTAGRRYRRDWPTADYDE
ncbi:putative membrane protein [Nocardia sp. GAS34]